MRAIILRSVPPVVFGALLVLLYAIIPHPRALIAGRYVLTQSDLPGFTQFGSGEDASCPFWGMPTIKEEMECQESAGSFFVTNEAFVAGLTWEGALEASRSAPFVASHHGAFEVNDSVLVFSTPEVAHRYYKDFTRFDNEPPDFSWQVLPAPTLGDESLTTRQTQGGPYIPVPEPSLVAIWRRGRVVTRLNTYGSSDQNSTLLLRLAALLDQRIQQQGQ